MLHQDFFVKKLWIFDSISNKGNSLKLGKSSKKSSKKVRKKVENKNRGNQFVFEQCVKVREKFKNVILSLKLNRNSFGEFSNIGFT